MEHYSNTFDINKEIEKIKLLNKKNDFDFNEVIKVCRNNLLRIRKDIISDGFDSIKEEIHFFKVTKQKPLQSLIYYSELNSISSKFSKGDKTIQQKQITIKIKSLNKFLQTNNEFVQYIKQDLRHLDKYYFTRKYSSEFSSLFTIPFFRDPEFSTSHDLILAKIKAYEKLIDYLVKQLNEVNNPIFQEIPKSQLKWTSSKVALTELTYALYHGGAVNNGNTDIREIATALERTFNFPIGDVYRTYSEIRSRKNRRSKFLDELSSSLLNGMDSLDK